MKRAMFVGRWQPMHNGHKWLISQKLDKGIPILICVRDIPPDAKNPFTTAQTVEFTRPFRNARGNFSFGLGMGVGVEIRQKPNATAATMDEDVAAARLLQMQMPRAGVSLH